MPQMTTTELEAARGGETAEQSRYRNPAGMYVLTRDDGTEDRIPAMFHPKFGTAQADAYIRLGYKWERPLNHKEMRAATVVLDNQAHSSHVGSADLVPRSQVTALEERIAALESGKKPKAGLPEELSAETGPGTQERGESEFPAKPVAFWNGEQLQAKARQIGVEGAELMTNKELRELISAHGKQ